MPVRPSKCPFDSRTAGVPDLMAQSPTLFSSLKIGAFDLAHRIVMPAMTRCRSAAPDGVPTRLMARYYAERSTVGGLLISEATCVCASGHCDRRMPGLYTAQQVNRWREATRAVHDNGGVILAQLTFMSQRPSERHDLDAAINAYRSAAENAGDAGFDGVELHATHGALPDLFIRGHATAEQGDYAGNSENRARLLVEILETLEGVQGTDRVGICLSLDARDPGNDALCRALAALPMQHIAYAHVAPSWRLGLPVPEEVAPVPIELVRSAFGGRLILSGGYTTRLANSCIGAGSADAVGFGRLFVANPDLPRRLFTGMPLADFDPASLYTGGAQGYVGQAA